MLSGNSDTFTTEQLERRLAHSRAITLAGQGEASVARKTVFGFAKQEQNSDDDD